LVGDLPVGSLPVGVVPEGGLPIGLPTGGFFGDSATVGEFAGEFGTGSGFAGDFVGTPCNIGGATGGETGGATPFSIRNRTVNGVLLPTTVAVTECVPGTRLRHLLYDFPPQRVYGSIRSTRYFGLVFHPI
jgi:hypothetical protein